MARLLVREQAWVDLEEVGAFIAKDNPAAAAEVVRQLRVSFEQLARMPQLGRLVTKIKTSDTAVCRCDPDGLEVGSIERAHQVKYENADGPSVSEECNSPALVLFDCLVKLS